MGNKSSKSASPIADFPASWLGAAPSLARDIVAEAGERGARLVEAWVEGKNAAAVAEIADDDRAPAPARKAARRGLGVLKSRGVPVPERTPRVARMTPEAETYEAWFRAPDAAGTSALTFGARTASGRYRLVDVILRSGAGIVSLVGLQIGRGELQETFARIEKRFGASPAAVPVDWARSRIAEARTDNDRTGTVVPLGFDSHRDLLGPPPAGPVSHPAEVAELARPDQALALGRSAKLHAEPELRGWLPDPPAMQRLMEGMGSELSALLGQGAKERARTEGSQGPREEAEALAKAAIVRETDRFFTEAMCLEYQGRMRDAAIPMIARGAKDRAADLLATAAVVGSLGAMPPHEVPFLCGFFEKAFGLLAARLAARTAAPPRSP